MGILAYKKASLFIDKSIPDHKEIKLLYIILSYIDMDLGVFKTMDFDLSK